MELAFTASPPRMRGLVAISLKLFWWKVHEMSRCAHITAVLSTPHSSIDSDGVGLIPPKIVFPRTWTKDHDQHRKLVFTTSYPSWGGWSSFDWIIFTNNCMKYPDLHTKVCSLTPNPPGMWVNFHRNFITRKLVKCPDLYRKLMFGNLQIGKGWGFSLTFFVLDIALLYTLGLNPP